jgi:hypothetical protein
MDLFWVNKFNNLTYMKVRFLTGHILFLNKCKVVPVLFLTEHHAMKAYWVNGGIILPILDLGTRWRWVVSFTPRPPYLQGKSPWYPLDRRLGGPQSRSGCGGEEKNSQPLPRLEPPIMQPISQRYPNEFRFCLFRFFLTAKPLVLSCYRTFRYEW